MRKWDIWQKVYGNSISYIVGQLIFPHFYGEASNSYGLLYTSIRGLSIFQNEMFLYTIVHLHYVIFRRKSCLCKACRGQGTCIIFCAITALLHTCLCITSPCTKPVQEQSRFLTDRSKFRPFNSPRGLYK